MVLPPTCLPVRWVWRRMGGTPWSRTASGSRCVRARLSPPPRKSTLGSGKMTHKWLFFGPLFYVDIRPACAALWWDVMLFRLCKGYTSSRWDLMGLQGQSVLLHRMLCFFSPPIMLNINYKAFKKGGVHQRPLSMMSIYPSSSLKSSLTYAKSTK